MKAGIISNNLDTTVFYKREMLRSLKSKFCLGNDVFNTLKV